MLDNQTLDNWWRLCTSYLLEQVELRFIVLIHWWKWVHMYLFIILYIYRQQMNVNFALYFRFLRYSCETCAYNMCTLVSYSRDSLPSHVDRRTSRLAVQWHVRLCFSGSTSCTFHVLTPNRPLVLSGNERLTFAPYHTHYPRLEEHMAAAGLQAKPNLWDNPLCMGRLLS